MDRSRLNASYLTAAEELQLVVSKESLLISDLCRTSIPLLYKSSPAFFVVDFYWPPYQVKYPLPRVSSPEYTVQGLPLKGTEDGLDFSGVIQVNYTDQTFEIKVPAEYSYDPAGFTGSNDNNEVVKPHQHVFFKAFLITIVSAVAYGVTEADLDETFQAFQSLITGVVRKTLIIEWLYEQVKVACFYEMKPPRYGEFLVSRLMGRIILLGPSQTHTKEYLESLLVSEKHGTQVHLPEYYFVAIEKQTQLTNEPRELAKRSMAKLLPPLLPQMQQLVDKGEDLLECSMLAYSLDMAYSQNIRDGCQIF